LKASAISTAAKNGLVPVKVDTWENFVFVKPGRKGLAAEGFLGAIPALWRRALAKKMKYFRPPRLTLNCNWKVYVTIISTAATTSATRTKAEQL